MSQTWLGSIVEAKTNIAIGFAINWTANMVFLPMFGFTTLTATKAFAIGLVFTVISIIRQLIIRRWFNGMKFGNTEAAK
jgi:membrane protein CcdC involved in cytochrome C biogenesis